ncbi:hypothetical protein YTPLAS73_09840 [Nitrosarchaeum sp.]|nr:hypothetical protein YTPLAS73_09840 [Nitrosarchaeum sp.]
MSAHSERAKSGTRSQISAQIRFLQTNITVKKKELAKAMEFKKYNLPGFETQITRIKQGIAKAEKDLAVFEKRKEKLIEDGLI